MKIKNTKVYGQTESMIRSGYPMQTGEPADFGLLNDAFTTQDEIRAFKLAKTPTGSGHSNFLKGIIVQFDLCYPQYFTPQLQRYNWIDIISSQSKMHKLTSVKDISEHCNKYVLTDITNLISRMIENYNNPECIYPVKADWDGYKYAETKEQLFQYIISNLPMGYELWMGISTNYLQLKTIYKQRKNHKLKEDWGYFCDWIESLPMSDLITK